jgi:nucleotide-binding universal stress UspA family protein
MTWGPIVIGVDASTAGAGAAAAGWELAQATGAQCTLVHAAREVWLGASGAPGMVDLGVVMEDVMRASRAEVERSLSGHVPKELLAAMEVRSGPPAQVLRDVVAERGAELVVLGAKRHGLVARWLGGSTAKNAIRALDVSVLVTTGPKPFARVLVPVDLSEMAVPTLHTAERVARLFGATLRVLHVVEPFPYAAEGITVVDVAELARQSEEAFHKTVWPRVTYSAAEAVVRRGPAAAMIEHEAVEWPADLVVVGAHGRGRVERIFLGSVSEGVVNALPTSVLVVRGAGPGAGTH